MIGKINKWEFIKINLHFMLGKKKMKTFHCINLSMKGGCPDGGQLCNVVFRWTVINRTIDYNTQLLSGPKCTANLYSIKYRFVVYLSRCSTDTDPVILFRSGT